MFCYYGSKRRLAPYYPPPIYDTIVEPFAGAASYACLYPNKQVFLFDIDPNIVNVWNYLINADQWEIASLPILKPGESLFNFKLNWKQRLFLGFMISASSSVPKITATSQTRWTANKRQEIAEFVSLIKHWSVNLLDFRSIIPIEATWFVDPPYQAQGKFYNHSLKESDYETLGYLCKNVWQGQVIVCEDVTATWLPFRALETNQGQKGIVITEGIWTNVSPQEKKG